MSNLKTIISIKESRKKGTTASKLNPLINRIPSGSHQQKTPKMSKNKYQITIDSAASQKIQSESYKELIKQYHSLHISNAYINSFNYVLESLPSIYQSSFISNEFSKVTKLKFGLLKLQKQIASRDKIIELLQQYDKYLTLEYDNIASSDIVIEDCRKVLNDLRVTSINIVMIIMQVRKTLGYECSIGKIDLNDEIFNFRKYIQKMKYDIQFLSQSTIGKYFRFGEEYDTFLTSLKRDIPYSDEVSRMITKCQHFFIKEQIHMHIEEMSNRTQKQSPVISKFDYAEKENNINQSNCPVKEKANEDIKKLITFNIDSQSTFSILPKVKPKEKEEVKNQPLSYKYEYYSGKINDIQKVYSEYYLKIPRDLKIALNIKDNISYYIKGTFPQIIQIKQGESLVGFAIISYYECDKLYISNISCIDDKAFSDLLINFVNHINEHFSYKELYIEMYYDYVDEKFILIKLAEDAIKTKAKFRWVNMENDGTMRKIKYKLINKNYDKKDMNTLKVNDLGVIVIKDVAEKKTNKSQINNEDMQHDSLDENNNESALVIPEKPIDKKEEMINKFPLLSLFCEMMYNGEYNIESETLRYMNMEEMKNVSDGMIHNFIKAEQKSIEDFIKENINSIELNNLSILHSDTKYNFASAMKLDVFFDNVITTKINNKVYNRISYDKISMLELPSGEVFYLLKTKSEKISIMLYENTNPKSKLCNYFNKDSSNHLCLNDYINQIYSEMSSVNEETIKTKNIFIPAFTLKRNNDYNDPKVLDEFAIDTEEQITFTTGKYVQNDNITFEKDNKVDEHFIAFDIGEEDIVIEKEFIISVINWDTLTQFEIPSIATYIVDPTK